MIPEKSTVDEIRARFDGDVERFSNLETGQQAMIDSLLVLDLLPALASGAMPGARRLLDVGCGAGNYTLKMLERIPGLHCTLLDLSAPMLERARERVAAAGASGVKTVQGDIRNAPLGSESFDIIVAVAVLHHLRDDADWEATFRRLYSLLSPGGWLWIADLVVHDHPAVQAVMWERYGQYLESLGGAEYRQKVFAYIEKEDTPRSAMWQMDLMRRVGFVDVDLVRKNSVHGVFGGRRGSEDDQ